MNNSARLNRLFAADGRCVAIALDHGQTNEMRFLGGIQDMRQVVTDVAAANPDAIMLNPGHAPTLQCLPGRKPALILRTDFPNLYRETAPSFLFDELIDAPVERALRLDAACVIANLIYIAEQPQVYRQCIRNICQLKPECERYGMPLMAETRVMELNRVGGYEPVGDVEKLAPLVRQGIELGIDLVKVDPTDNPEDFNRLVQMAGDKPVLALGGGKASEEVLLTRTQALLRQGARGVLYGRNVFGHASPSAITRAIMAMVHSGATVEQALSLLRGKN